MPTPDHSFNSAASDSSPRPVIISSELRDGLLLARRYSREASFNSGDSRAARIAQRRIDRMEARRRLSEECSPQSSDSSGSGSDSDCSLPTTSRSFTRPPPGVPALKLQQSSETIPSASLLLRHGRLPVAEAPSWRRPSASLPARPPGYELPSLPARPPMGYEVPRAREPRYEANFGKYGRVLVRAGALGLDLPKAYA